MREQSVNDLRKGLLDVPLQYIKDVLAKEFYNMNNVIEALYFGITTGKNIILYGPGGFGKSQIVKRFLELAEIKTQTIVGNEDTEVDALLGIPNIKKLTEESTYEIAFDKTVFVNEGVLILEEFLDVRPATAAALKDILSEGGMRQGTKFIESKISSIIICTNKSPDELSIDDSSSAFYKERFPIRVKVAWKSYDMADYLEFLKLIRTSDYGDMESYYEVLAEIASRTSGNNIVSPRVMIDSADILSVHKDIKALQYVDGLDTVSIEEIIEYCTYTAEKISLKKVSERIYKWIDDTEVTSVVRTLNFVSELEYMIVQLSLKKIESPGNNVIFLNTITKCKETIEFLKNSMHGDLSDTRVEYLKTLLDDKNTKSD